MRGRATPLVLLFAFVAACSSGGSGATPNPTANASSTASAAATPTPGSGPFAQVTQADFQFTPSTFAIGTDQGLSIKNNGPSLHNFSIPGTQVDIDVQPGQSSNTESIGGVVKPGTYQFFCKYHKSRGMVGTITVVSST